MKHLKMLVLAVAGAAALMALVGAGSASATVICSDEGTETPTACPAGHEFEYDGPVVATLAPETNAVLETSIATVICPNSSTTLDPATSTGSPTITGEVTALSFGPSCHLNNAKETACTVTTVGVPTEAHLEGTVGGNTNNSRLVVTGTPGGTVVCGSIINCTFRSSGEVELTGGNTEGGIALSAEEVPLTRTGGLCPSTSLWTASYEAADVTVH